MSTFMNFWDNQASAMGFNQYNGYMRYNKYDISALSGIVYQAIIMILVLMDIKWLYLWVMVYAIGFYVPEYIILNGVQMDCIGYA